MNLDFPTSIMRWMDNHFSSPAWFLILPSCPEIASWWKPFRNNLVFPQNFPLCLSFILSYFIFPYFMLIHSVLLYFAVLYFIFLHQGHTFDQRSHSAFEKTLSTDPPAFLSLPSVLAEISGSFLHKHWFCAHPRHQRNLFPVSAAL